MTNRHHRADNRLSPNAHRWMRSLFGLGATCLASAVAAAALLAPQTGSDSTHLMLGGGLTALTLGSMTALLTRRPIDRELRSLG